MPHAEKMTNDTHIRDVFEGPLADELRRFFQTHLELAYGANWRDQVLPVLKQHDQQKWKRNPSLDIFDFAALISIALGLTPLQDPWHLELPCVDILHESRKVRNRWTHLPPGERYQPAVERRDWQTLLFLAQGYRLSETIIQFVGSSVEPVGSVTGNGFLEDVKDRYRISAGWLTQIWIRFVQFLVRSYQRFQPRFQASHQTVKLKLVAGFIAALRRFRFSVDWAQSQWSSVSIRTKKRFVISSVVVCISMCVAVVIYSNRNPELPDKDTPLPERLQLLHEMKTHDKDFLLCNVNQIDSLIRVNLIPHQERMRIKLESWRELPSLKGRTPSVIDSCIRLYFGTK